MFCPVLSDWKAFSLILCVLDLFSERWQSILLQIFFFFKKLKWWLWLLLMREKCFFDDDDDVRFLTEDFWEGWWSVQMVSAVLTNVQIFSTYASNSSTSDYGRMTMKKWGEKVEKITWFYMDMFRSWWKGNAGSQLCFYFDIFCHELFNKKISSSKWKLCILYFRICH